MGFPTLEELAGRDGALDIREFGLKTEGILELIRDAHLFSVEDVLGARVPLYRVEPGFVIPLSANATEGSLLADSLASMMGGGTSGSCRSSSAKFG